MQPGKTIPIAILLVLGVVVTAFGAYKYGSDRAYQAGYDEGRNVGYSKGFEDGDPSPSDKFKIEQFGKMINDYNSLVEDYNTLREDVIRYVGQIDYQTRQPITCNSSTWGINSQYTTTNCY